MKRTFLIGFLGIAGFLNGGLDSLTNPASVV